MTFRFTGAEEEVWTPEAVASSLVELLACDDFREAFFFLLPLLGSSHAYKGLKLSITPQSSKRLGYNQKALGKSNKVPIYIINLMMAIKKNKPKRPRRPIEMYQTPVFIKTGHKGNKITANTPAIKSKL